MTLTPPKFHIADDMPMSLGKAIARAIAPQPDRIEAFNKGQHSHIAFNSATKTCLLTPISEKDCRQIKGAAQATKPEQCRSGGPVAAPPSVQKFKVGDRVRWPAVGRDGAVSHVYSDGFVTFLLDGNEEGHDCGFKAENAATELELLISPASETETEGGGWVTWKRGMPIPCLPAGTRIAVDIGHRDMPRETNTHFFEDVNWESNSCVVAYRVVKP